MKPTGYRAAALSLMTILAACSGGGSTSPADSGTPATPPAPVTPPSPPAASASVRYKGEVWADNWFAAYVGSTKVAEDSVPITTERSFNSETFTFDATPPFELNLVIKDYKQDDSGLEYIGTPQQQIGDGGFIAQLTDAGTGTVVAASGSSWKCLVVHKAPLNKACAKDPDPLRRAGSA